MKMLRHLRRWRNLLEMRFTVDGAVPITTIANLISLLNNLT